jgi:DNA-binding NtrC family response regulator
MESSGFYPMGQNRVAVANSSSIAKNPSTLTVLVVDDEPLIRWSLRKGLLKHGHQVAEARTGAEALELIAADQDRFAVVILDYRLPDRQDLSMLRDVRRLAPRAAVVMMTAFGDADMRAKALQLGARAVVDKPFQIAELISLVESAGLQQ